MLQLKNINKHFGSKTVAQDINLNVEAGEILAVLGRSGCGKSTLLRCVNGLEPHQGGSIVMDRVGEFGKDVSWQTARQKVGRFESCCVLLSKVEQYNSDIIQASSIIGKTNQGLSFFFQ